MKKILQLAFTDFKLIFRDPSLRSFLVLPLVLFSLMVWAVPYLAERYEFIEPYLPLFLMIAVIENTQLFSFISSMVLIDEKETEVALVYGVVPLSKAEYIASRFLIPYLFTVVLNIILFQVQPLFEIHFGTNLLISFLAASVVPVYVMAINSIVRNRFEGMVYIKAFNMLVLVPVAAFFVPEQWKHLFGIFPTHWIFQSIELATQGLSTALMLIVGFIFWGGLMALTARLFLRKHFV